MAHHIEWIILVTDHFKASYTFYKDTLGFTVVRETQKEEFCQFSLEHGFLAIYGRTAMEKLVGKEHIKTAGGAIYTFAESEDIDRQYEDLKRKGVVFLTQPTTQPWGQRTAYFADPDGHIWEIQQWIKKG